MSGYTSPPPPGAGGPAPAWEPAAGGWQLASWWERFGAMLVDGIVVGAPAAVVLGIAIAAGNWSGLLIALGGALLFLLVALLYAPLMMSRTNGQTLGKMATGIRVVRADGGPMTFGFAALREVAVKGLLVQVVGSVAFGLAWLVDGLWPLWDDQNRALHDMVVNTRVVKA